MDVKDAILRLLERPHTHNDLCFRLKAKFGIIHSRQEIAVLVRELIDEGRVIATNNGYAGGIYERKAA